MFVTRIFQVCKILFQIIALLLFKGITIQKDKGSIMTNIYMSQLIVTRELKEKHAFTGIKFCEILLCMYHALLF